MPGWRTVAGLFSILPFLITGSGHPSHAQGSAGQAMIVLDGSGSMWGQINGEAKISMARRVLADVLATSPRELSLGLMAYGHRQKGQCDDIEILMSPAPGAGAEISGLADGISPKGKTPLSEAVRQAAEALRYTEERATVILITDGLETCNADPCALATALEESGIDFTAHVVGFGLSAEEGRQVACLAENTGGRYFPADDAASLGEALSDTVVEVAMPVPDKGGAEPAEEPATLPAASVSGPQSVEIGRRFSVTWDGPGERWDRVTLFDPRARNGEGREVTGRRVLSGDTDNRQVDLIAPVRTGPYELQYRYDSTGAVLARAGIEVIDAAVSLDAPPNVDIGRPFTVAWVGPGGRLDRVQVIDPLANNGDGRVVEGKRLVNDDFDNRKVTLIAPAEPGFYTLQYWNGDSRAELATRQIEVLEAAVSISAPATVAGATDFVVDWIGPGGRRDRIEVMDMAADGGRGKAVSGKRLVNDDFDNRKVTLIAPAQPGDYTLRYWNGDNRAVLATRPISVEATAVSLDAPQAVKMGTVLDVGWTGPGARRDRIEIFDAEARAGRGKTVSTRRVVNGDMDRRIVSLKVPVKTGTYALRYWNGDSNVVLAEQPLTVEPVPVAVRGPASTEAGTQIEVEWEGPGASRDTIQIARASDGKVVSSRRVDPDTRTVTLKVPDAGAYVLRYWNTDFGAVLAEQPLTVQ